MVCVAIDVECVGGEAERDPEKLARLLRNCRRAIGEVRMQVPHAELAGTLGHPRCLKETPEERRPPGSQHLFQPTPIAFRIARSEPLRITVERAHVVGAGDIMDARLQAADAFMESWIAGRSKRE